MRSNRIPKQYSAAFLSALMLFMGSPGQWAIAPVMWIALIPLINSCLTREISITSAARLGFICGLLYNTALLYWIVIALGRYGGLPLPVSVFAMLGLAAYMALYFAFFTATLSATKKLVPVLFSAPIIWVGLDQIKAWLFTGFPWQDLGYSQFQTPLLIQIADITGHSGITFLLVMTNALIATILCKGPRKSLHPQHTFGQIPTTVVACLLIVGTVIYGQHRLKTLEQVIEQAPTLTTAVMQGNIDQSEKWSADGQEKTVQTYLELTELASTDRSLALAIWPETALPFFPGESTLLSSIQEFAAAANAPEILTGAPHYSIPVSGTTNYFNSAFLITDNSLDSMQRYDKQQLVPFG
nr:apolipoprotein N-acyltransferase [Desulfobulbaceae bacterium]